MILMSLELKPLFVLKWERKMISHIHEITIPGLTQLIPHTCIILFKCQGQSVTMSCPSLWLRTQLSCQHIFKHFLNPEDTESQRQKHRDLKYLR